MIKCYKTRIGSYVSPHLSQVKLEHIAYVMRVEVRKLHQVLSVLKGLAQLFHTRLRPIYTINALEMHRK